MVRRLARPLGGQYAGGRCDQFQFEERFLRVTREPAPRRALDAHRAQYPRIQGPGTSAKSSPDRATRRIEFITSRAASKETMPCRASSADGAWKSAPLQRGEVPIRGPRTAKIACYPFDWIRCCSSAQKGGATSGNGMVRPCSGP